jgi:hypothetical protein
MTRLVPAAVLAVVTTLPFGSLTAAEWLLANRCRNDDCSLRWVVSVAQTGEGRFRVETSTARWQGTDDPPVLGEPERSVYDVSCAADAPYVENALGQRTTISPVASTPVRDDETALWRGVCRDLRETINRVD